MTAPNLTLGVPPDSGSIRQFSVCAALDCSRFETVTATAVMVRGPLAIYLDVAPYMRSRISPQKNYAAGVAPGEVMIGGAIAEVVESNTKAYAAGDIVVTDQGFGWQEYAALRANAVRKVDPDLAPLPYWMDALGLNGMTAYFALLDVGQPKAGDTVVISGAAGAVGSIVGQIAKIKGCRVVGIAGGAEKCQYLKDELGFDGVIDYKAEDVLAGLKRECPKGVDVYFDNVGGDILDTVLTRLAMRARIVICGAISQYNNTTPMKGPSNYMSLLVNRASMKTEYARIRGLIFGAGALQVAATIAVCLALAGTSAFALNLLLGARLGAPGGGRAFAGRRVSP